MCPTVSLASVFMVCFGFERVLSHVHPVSQKQFVLGVLKATSETSHLSCLPQMETMQTVSVIVNAGTAHLRKERKERGIKHSKRWQMEV